ncbi:MAG: Mut7-C RNAse domain-containing protein [Candidatus Cloacimonetes bacterium]|nr:Mut7-C RNAse domain-containing protein [Candidatus Cloacimonadota bacterium]
MKFYCDRDVLRLAKYLRFAGFDTVTRIDLSTDKKYNLCKKQRRVFITRKKNIMKGLFKGHLEVVDSNNYLEQIDYILTKFPVEVSKIGTRCIECNKLLRVCNNEKNSKICPHCKKRYWAGKHYQAMLGVILKYVTSNINENE